MEKGEYTYEIAGKKYIQRKLVLGQVKQVIGLLEGVSFRPEDTVTEIMAKLNKKLPIAIAIVLTEEGKTLRGKVIESLAEELEFEIDIETSIRVIEDFFDCNPIASLVDQMTGTIGKTLISAGQAKAGLMSSVSSSPEETLQSGTPSSGDTLSKSVSPTSNIAEKK